MLYYENKLRREGYDFIIGIDEVGRGCLAGPVVAAAVLLKETRFRSRIDDSKRLTSLQRETAFPEIVDKSAFGVGIVSEKAIDRLNIAVATSIAMEKAVSMLLKRLGPCDGKRICLMVDGTVKLKTHLPYINIIRGDSKSKSIACASILAKVTRDSIMSSYDVVYPQYGFWQHKGYPTRLHRVAVERFGLSRIHRISFCHAAK